MSGLGGEPACWAHLVDELDRRLDTDRITQIDLTQLDGEGRGAVWSLPHDGDLDANVVRLPEGESIGQHVNHEVDVLIVIWGGTGEVTIDDRPLRLHPGVATLVPRGTSRTIHALGGGMTYLTVHRRRGPLAIGRR